MPAPPTGPASLLAALPAYLRRPLAPPEVVLVGWSPDEPDWSVVLTHTHGHDSDPRDEANLARQAVIDGAEQVAVVVAVPAHLAQQHPHPHLVGRYIAAACSRWGLDVLDVVVVTGDRWRSLTCDDPTCCLPEGTPMPTPVTPQERTS